MSEHALACMPGPSRRPSSPLSSSLSSTSEEEGEEFESSGTDESVSDFPSDSSSSATDSAVKESKRKKHQPILSTKVDKPPCRPSLRKLRKKFPPRCETGAPMSLKSTTNQKCYTVVDYSKPDREKNEACRRNEISIEGIHNIPDGFAWTDDVPLAQEEPHFTGPTPGPTTLKNGSSVVDAFSLISSDWIAKWLELTNNNGRESLLEDWQDVTEHECALFLANLLHMSVKKLPQLWMYWDDPEFSSESVKSTMKRKRFFQIFRYSRMYYEGAAKQSGESCYTSANYDPNFRVQAVWKAFILSCQAAKNPTKNMTIDETIIAFKGRFKGNTMNPNKPGNKNKGLRVLSLCDGDAYVLNATLHTKQPRKYDQKGKFFGIIFALLESHGLEGPSEYCGTNYLNKGHRIFCDNLYTEISTIVALRHKNTYYCGTTRRGRAFLPKPILVSRPSEVTLYTMFV